MTNVYDVFENEMRAVMSAPNEGEALRRFYRAMKVKAEIVSRDLVVNDTARLQSQSGEIRILYELADWAGAALEALKSEAKDGGAGRIPQELT